MTTIATVRYDGGRITGADSRATSLFSDYEDTFEKTFTLNGSNILVQMAGSVAVAEKAVNIIAAVMMNYPNDDIESHADEISAGLEMLARRLKEEQSRAGVLMGSAPSDNFSKLIVTVSDGSATKSFVAEVGVTYDRTGAVYTDTGKEIHGSATIEAELLNSFKKLNDAEAVAVGPDPRSQLVLETILSGLGTDPSKISEDEAKAAVLALIKTFSDKNEGVHWPIHQWKVEDHNPIPTEVATYAGENEVTGTSKELLEHIMPLANKAFDVATLEYMERYFNRERDSIKAKLDEERDGKVTLKQEDREFLQRRAIQNAMYTSQIGAELARAKQEQRNEIRSLRQYISQRDTVKGSRGQDVGHETGQQPSDSIRNLQRRDEAQPTPKDRVKNPS